MYICQAFLLFYCEYRRVEKEPLYIVLESLSLLNDSGAQTHIYELLVRELPLGRHRETLEKEKIRVFSFTCIFFSSFFFIVEPRGRGGSQKPDKKEPSLF